MLYDDVGKERQSMKDVHANLCCRIKVEADGPFEKNRHTYTRIILPLQTIEANIIKWHSVCVRGSLAYLCVCDTKRKQKWKDHAPSLALRSRSKDAFNRSSSSRLCATLEPVATDAYGGREASRARLSL